jgi:DNA-binding SARP family transcriptional activator
VPERLWFTLLGPVRAWRGPDEVDLGSPQQRTALAALLLREGAQASVDELIDAVWGADAPRSAEKAIRTYVYRLRRALQLDGDDGQPVIETVGNGYVMRVTAEESDLALFRRELSSADTARKAGELGVAAGHLRSALALWQGTPLAGIQGMYADAQRITLENLRRSAIEARLTLDFQLGEFTKAAVELTTLVAENPLDERFRELLMLALYRSGRQAEALNTYRQGQIVLADELGIDPGPGLRSTYERILRADPELIEQDTEPEETTAEQPFPRPAQLPPDLPNFTGRDAELMQLDALLASGSDGLVTVLIAGMAGVGKTTLAVHWAHRLAQRFPDGQLYVNLRGFEPTGTTMTAAEAMRAVLESLGHAPRAIPADLSAQTVLYRSLLAGRRVLVLLDNARDADQVRPLLPGTPGCLVIVTSRTQLPSLIAADGAHPVNLDLLPTADARVFLANRLGAARLAAEPAPTQEIIQRCAGLPLALAIVSARAALNPRFPLAAIAAELRDPDGSLDAFSVSDTAVDVRDVFSWSYHALDDPAARLFRLLALHPGPDISTNAAASIAGLTRRQTRALLGTLTRSHLLIEHVPGRFTSHDLLRAYEGELTATHDSDAERQAALRRMLDHYLHSAYDASQLLSPHREPIPLPDLAADVVVVPLAGADQASDWFTTEHNVLLALIRDAYAQGFDAHTWRLAWTVVHFLDRRGHWQDLLSAQQLGLDAAERSDDRYGQAVAHLAMARADADLGLYEDSLSHLGRTLELFGEAGDKIGQAHTHRQFSWVLEQQGNNTAALAHAYQSLELYRALRDSSGEAMALNAVGWYHARLGQYEDALALCGQARALLTDMGEYYGLADTMDSIGFAYQHLHRYDEAIEAYERSVALYRELGVSFAEADTSNRLGEVLREAGRTAAAQAAFTRALDLFTQLGHPSAAAVRNALMATDA